MLLVNQTSMDEQKNDIKSLWIQSIHSVLKIKLKSKWKILVRLMWFEINTLTKHIFVL